MEYSILGLLSLSVILLLVLVLRKPDTRAAEELKTSVRSMCDSNLTAINAIGQSLMSNQSAADDKREAQTRAFEKGVAEKLEAQSGLVKLLRETTTAQVEQMDKKLSSDQEKLRAEVSRQTQELQRSVNEKMSQMVDSIGRMNTVISEGMSALREENSKKLDEIRGTVDEKLQTTLEKRISESFKTVSEQLEQVYKGLGEMQSLASDVGGLKKVLSGVKTRGILGEIQLKAILEEILSPEQYDTNIATVPNSTERVEFAIKLPGTDGRVYLPIDSKFPGERYAQLLDAQESGDKTRVDAAYKALETVIKQEAKDIRTKYVCVPHTTNFGIMFLPFEGLYAEVVNRGLVEVLQRDYQINVAGPSTMAALLNSLQMGFKTLAIQKRSNEVWELLGAVKTEFDKFEEVMQKMKNHLNQTSNDLELMLGTRSRAISRKLREVQTLDDEKSSTLLELSDTN